MKIKDYYGIINTFFWVARVGLGLLLVASSLPKIRYTYDFLNAVYSYELLSPEMGLFLTVIIPWIELICGLCLLVDVLVHGALLGVILLFSVFTAAILNALLNGLSISCGCFGFMDSTHVDYYTLARSILLLGLSSLLYVYFCYRTSKALPSADPLL